MTASEIRSLQTRILHVTIAVPLAAAYAFAHKPENFPRWAAGLATALHESEQGWVADTPEGEAQIEFSPPNDQGVLDHDVRIAGRPEIYVPMRMIANGDATEVELVLFRQPGKTDAQFDGDTTPVRKDLAALKRLLETS
jgi:hypothetical protein